MHKRKFLSVYVGYPGTTPQQESVSNISYVTSEILSAYIKTYKYILTDVGFNIHTVPQHVFIP